METHLDTYLLSVYVMKPLHTLGKSFNTAQEQERNNVS